MKTSHLLLRLLIVVLGIVVGLASPSCIPSESKECLDQQESRTTAVERDKTFVLNSDASILDYLNPALFDQKGYLDEIGKKLARGDLVVIENAFDPEFAEYVWTELYHKDDDEWIVIEGANDDGFHFHHHNIYPSTTDFIEDLLHIFNHYKSRKFMSTLSGRDCFGDEDIELMASNYMPGDHSLPHADYAGTRTLSFVWHLTKDWDPRWGGALYWCPAHRFKHSFLHASFNTLNLFTVSPNSTHFVTAVSNQVKNTNSKRLAVNGWYVADWEPDLSQPVEEMSEADRLKLTAYQREAIMGTNFDSVTDDPERLAKLESLRETLDAELSGTHEEQHVHFVELDA